MHDVTLFSEIRMISAFNILIWMLLRLAEDNMDLIENSICSFRSEVYLEDTQILWRGLMNFWHVARRLVTVENSAFELLI